MSKWEMVRLGDVCTIVTGTTPKSTEAKYWNGSYNWVTPAELDDNSEVVFETQRKITEEGIKNSSLRPFPAGTVLLSSRAPIGKVAIAGIEMYCNQGFKNFVCKDKIFNKYLFWFLKGKKEYLNSLGRGATFKEISKKIVEAIEIPLPPLAIQQQIANTLDTAAALLALRKQQLAELDVLIQSVFIEMFGDPILNTKNLDIESIEKLCKVIVDCPHSTPKYIAVNTGFKCLKTSNLKPNEINWNDVGFISEEQYKERIKRYEPQQGDIVYSREGAILGIAAMLDKMEKIALGQRLMLLSVDESICNSFYLCHSLNSEGVKIQVRQKTGGSASPHINIANIKNFKIPLPPIQLQTQFAAIVAKTEQQKALVQQAIDETQNLFDSLMAEYFE